MTSRILATVRGISRALDGSIDGLAKTDEERFTLSLEGCYWIAAPVVMFRLKRLGYSEVRVTSSRGGLVVTFRR